MTHTLGTKKINWKKYDCVFGSAGPMLCPDGMVLTIVRTSKIRKRKDIPVMTDYNAFIVSLLVFLIDRKRKACTTLRRLK